jgi:hypothetical protein
MKNNNRRTFVEKTCLLGLCGFGSLSGLARADETKKTEESKPESIHSRWISSLLLGLKDENPETVKMIIKNRSEAHFDDLNLNETLAPYVGNLEAFHSFLRNEWGWIIDYDKERGIVNADENKNYCVCPLIRNKKMEGLGMLCYCSEGIAERMFSYVSGNNAKAEVAQSILRGAKSCRYKITILKTMG